MIKEGIDLSRWNIVSDYKKVKKAGISFAIIKAGGSENGLFKDRKFEEHYKGLKEAKIDVGAYFYAGKDFISSARGLEAAKYFHSLLSFLLLYIFLLNMILSILNVMDGKKVY